MPAVDEGARSLEATTQQFIDELAARGERTVDFHSVAGRRDLLTRAQSVPIGKPDASIELVRFPVGPTGSIVVHIIRPRHSHGALSLIMYFHGGGWILGGIDTHDRLAREIAVGVHAVVVFVDFDRSPEAHYPIVIEQAYAASKYVADHARPLAD